MSEQVTAPVGVPVAYAAGRGRRLAVYLLLLVAGALLLLTSFAVWVDRVALNTNQFVDTSSKLIDDGAIRQEIATRAVDELYANVDVQAELQRQAPKDLKPLSGVAAAGLRQGAYILVDRALQQPALQSVWQATLRRSHQQLVDVLEGGGTGISTQEGVVTLDLRRIVLDTADRIGLRRTAEQKLPADVGRVEVLRSDQLGAAQNGFELLKTLAWFLPILTLIAFGLAVWLAAGMRRAAVRDVGIAIVAGGIVGLIAVRIVGNYVVDALATDTQSRAAGADAWTIVTDLLRSSLRWQIVVGILIVLAAALAGPRRYAVSSRHVLAPLLRERIYPYGALVVLALVLLLTGPVADFARFLSVFVVLALLAAGIEVLRRQTLQEFPDGSSVMSFAEARTRTIDWLGSRRPARASVPEESAAESSVPAQLRALSELHQSGALTDEEYAAAKARVLAES